ncbi:uncharacterized protein [Antedon mediterranea]|uniref:uncharacterized protein isoform X2 n=1 Tax=Antedon mediterranea TaxID=105859 RepID=UPI003AF4A311
MKHGASLSLGNKDGNTPLHLYLHSIYTITLEIVTFLIKHGASLTFQNKDGDTPLHLCRSGIPTLETVKFLIQQGASLTLQNKEGSTPMTILKNNTNKIYPDERKKILKFDFDKLLVPAEIYSKGKYAIKIYKDELQNGEISVVNSRCMFLGKEGAGKTSCVKAMLGERFNSREPSTDGIVTTTVFQAKKDCRKWKKVKDVDGVKLSQQIRAHALEKKLNEGNDNTWAQVVNIARKGLTLATGKVDVSDIKLVYGTTLVN